MVTNGMTQRSVPGTVSVVRDAFGGVSRARSREPWRLPLDLSSPGARGCRTSEARWLELHDQPMAGLAISKIPCGNHFALALQPWCPDAPPASTSGLPMPSHIGSSSRSFIRFVARESGPRAPLLTRRINRLVAWRAAYGAIIA
jgi:hypothetical protein